MEYWSILTTWGVDLREGGVNSTETVLTTMALYYFPWPGKLRWVCRSWISVRVDLGFQKVGSWPFYILGVLIWVGVGGGGPLYMSHVSVAYFSPCHILIF